LSGRRTTLRFWIQAIIAGTAGILFLVTLVWRDWLEMFGIEPDGGSGAAEWLVVGGLLAISIVFGGTALREWRRAALSGA